MSETVDRETRQAGTETRQTGMATRQAGMKTRQAGIQRDSLKRQSIRRQTE